MLTNRESIFRIKRLFREVHSDSRLSNRLVFSLMDNHTKWLISRDSQKGNIIETDSAFQKLKCVEVIEAPLIDPCCGIRSKCKVFRTKNRIPDIYEDTGGVIIRDVLTIDGSLSLTLIKSSDWERKQNNPWLNKTDKNRFYFFHDGYLYFPNGSWKMVEINALFTRDISDLNLCDDKGTCDDETKQCIRFLDKRFIIPQYLEAQMFQAVIQDLGNTYKKLVEKSTEINKKDQ